MKLNLITLVILLIVADLTLLFLPQSLLLPWQVALVIALALIFLFIFLHRNFFVFLAFFVVSLGYTHHSAFSLLQQAQSVTAQKQVVTFEIQEILHQQDYQTLIATATLADNLREQRIFLNWKAKEVPQLSEIWQAEISLRPLSARLNFGGFDRQQWYFSKRITAVGIVKSAVKIADISSLRAEKLQQVKKQTEGLSLQGLLNALAFGERAWLDKNTWSIYQQTNTAHLIAISGLHIGVLISLIYFILLKLKVSVDYIEKIILIIIPLYMLLSGASASVLRAGFMIIFYIIFRRKSIDKLDSLLLTFLILLFYNPLYTFNIGFQLSFFITFSLLMSESYIKTSKNKLHMSLRISIISTLASMPILLYNFYTIVYISVLSNIVLVPIFSIILFPLVLISYIIFLLSVPIFNILCRPLLNFTFSIFDKLQEIFLYIKPLRIGKQSIFIIIVIFIVVVYIMTELNRLKYSKAAIGVFTVAIILIISSYIPREYIEEIKIGKENIYYIRENRNNMIINTSSNIKNFYTDYRKKDREYDIMSEYDSLLNYEGKDRINYLLLTSAKKNKSEYATNLLANNLVNKIIVVDSVTKKLLELKDIAQYKKVEYIVLNNGTEMKFGSTSVFYYDKKVKVKNQDREFEIEVDD